ncbi:hypothetical protein SUGI_1112340 [Cryptomeria japonica]|nr:hypothetical protein SUGI_1112340 [Cryptomeria japonica]
MASSRISGNKRTRFSSSFGSSPAFGQPGSSSFGQPGSSSFGSQPTFGQQNSAVNNSFAARPFRTTSPFGPQTGSTLFGGNSNDIFGASPSPSLVFGVFGSPKHAQSSPFETNSEIQPAFGRNRATPQSAPATSSSPGFGHFASASAPIGFSSFASAPIFGATSTPATSSSPGFSSFASASTPSPTPLIDLVVSHRLELLAVLHRLQLRLDLAVLHRLLLLVQNLLQQLDLAFLHRPLHRLQHLGVTHHFLLSVGQI